MSERWRSWWSLHLLQAGPWRPSMLFCTTSTSKITKIINSTKTLTGCAMAYVVTCQPVAAVAQVRSQASSCRIYGGWSGTGTDLSLSIWQALLWVFQFCTVSATYSSLICKPSNWYKHRIVHPNTTNITLSSTSPLWSSVFPLVWDGLRENFFY